MHNHLLMRWCFSISICFIHLHTQTRTHQCKSLVQTHKVFKYIQFQYGLKIWTKHIIYIQFSKWVPNYPAHNVVHRKIKTLQYKRMHKKNKGKDEKLDCYQKVYCPVTSGGPLQSYASSSSCLRSVILAHRGQVVELSQ